MSLNYVSYSAWKDWVFCPHKYKITRVDKVRLFKGNEFSTFGTAVHDTVEASLLLEKKRAEFGGLKDDSEEINLKKHFLKSFQEEIQKLIDSEVKVDLKLVEDMKKQGEDLVELIIPEIKNVLGEYTIVSAEEEIRQGIDGNPNFDFYGFIDSVFKTSDGKYHIVDWKTCSWGWDIEKKTSTETTYQLTYYKHFFCQKHKLDPAMVETYFGLLKRTANKDKVEIYRVTSGPKKVENALKVLDNCVKNVEKGNFIKNKLSCTKCEFHKTIYCP
jgi:ATP-dependent exoDNAse (exonuclease V) beta subunit